MTPRFSTLGCFDVITGFSLQFLLYVFGCCRPVAAGGFGHGCRHNGRSRKSQSNVAHCNTPRRDADSDWAGAGFLRSFFPPSCSFLWRLWLFSPNSINPLFSKALWIYLPLNLFPHHSCVFLVLLRTFCARNAGKGCERSAVFHSMKIPPEYFNWSDGKCDLGKVLNAKQPGIYFIKVAKAFEL